MAFMASMHVGAATRHAGISARCMVGGGVHHTHSDGIDRNVVGGNDQERLGLLQRPLLGQAKDFA